MADIVNIKELDPTTFDFQDYSLEYNAYNNIV